MQFFNIFYRDIKSCLNDRTFGSQHCNLFILIPESRTYPPRITYCKRFTASGQSANDISPVPFTAGGTQYVSQINMLFYIVGDSHACKPFGLGKVEHTFHFTIKPVPHLFQHDIGISILTGMLSNGCDTGKNFIYIRHVEVTAESQVLGTPIVSPQKRVHIRDTGFPGCRITQMPHIRFTRKR